jgi:hypothetical protein
MAIAVLLAGSLPAGASHTPEPASVAIAGSLQDELGCSGDWQPDCAATYLEFDAGDRIWWGTFTLPAGDWEYKAALNDSWDENYGAGGVAGSDNIGLALGAGADVTFYYSHESHWVTDNVNSAIATSVGSFQEELGCPGDWQPDCLHSWLQDLDGDGTYTFTTAAIPVGNHEFKVAIDESWDENYGDDGIAGGANIALSVPEGAGVTFSWDSATLVPSVSVNDVSPPKVTAGIEIERGGPKVAWFTVHYECADPDTTTAADINGEPVEDGETVRLLYHPQRTDHQQKKNRLDFYGQGFLLTVTCTDSSGNSATVEVVPTFP